jgi:hypothetical protein
MYTQVQSVNAHDLTKEAVQMARHRNRPAELRMVAQLLPGEPSSKELLAQAEKVAKANETRAKETLKEKALGITGYVTVANHTGYYIRVYVNDDYVFTIAPYKSRYYYVGDDPEDVTTLEAYAGSRYWSRDVPEPKTNYTWHVYP